jgi:hypothetical protein
VLGNSNLGQATPVRMTGERGQRTGGTTWRLRKRSGALTGEGREQGTMRRGKDGPEVISSGRNKGGQMGKNGREREEEMGEPSMAAPVYAGHLDQMMHG